MQGGQFFRFPVFQFPGVVRRGENLPRPDAPDEPDADVITAATPGTHPEGRVEEIPEKMLTAEKICWHTYMMQLLRAI